MSRREIEGLKALVVKLREVLEEIVTDRELVELMREPDNGEHGSTVARAHAALAAYRASNNPK